MVWCQFSVERFEFKQWVTKKVLLRYIIKNQSRVCYLPWRSLNGELWTCVEWEFVMSMYSTTHYWTLSKLMVMSWMWSEVLRLRFASVYIFRLRCWKELLEWFLHIICSVKEVGDWQLTLILVDLLERINCHLRCASCPACFLPFDVLVGVFYIYINIIWNIHILVIDINIWTLVVLVFIWYFWI